MFLVEVADEAAAIYAEQRNRFHVWRLGTAHDYLLHRVASARDAVAVTEEKAARANHGGDLHIGSCLFYKWGIAVLEVFARTNTLWPAGRIAARRESRDKIGAGTERFHPLLHKSIQSLNDR